MQPDLWAPIRLSVFKARTKDGVIHNVVEEGHTLWLGCTQMDEGPRYDWTYVRDAPIPQVTCLACIAAQAEYGPDE